MTRHRKRRFMRPMTTNPNDFATRHGITLTAELIASRDTPGDPTGEHQTWRWTATTESGRIELEDHTDGSGPHDAMTRLFGWWQDERPTYDELEHALAVLGPEALAELLPG